MSKAPGFAAVLFTGPSLPDRKAASINIIYQKSSPRQNVIYSLRHLTHHSITALIYRGLKSPIFGLDFRLMQLPLSHPHFNMVQHI